jgi:isoleucyl-tRNA synthetase
MSNNLVNLEKKVTQFWKDQDTFQKSLEQTKNNKEFVFFDGPPFATGLPHHGHLVGSVLKDMMPRYFTMQGRYVHRKFGWDCHGLPVEHELEKKLGKSAKTLVQELGVAEYNRQCRTVVDKHESDWEYMMERLGRWVEFKDSYKTMQKDYMESVWYVFKELWNKGLVYKGNKVVPYSTKLNSVLSNFEAASNYKDVSDPSLYFYLKLKNKDYSLLVWTTTPWTLPANMGACLNKNLKYVLVLDKETNKQFVVSKSSLDSLRKDKELTVLSDLDASELEGEEYEPLFENFKDLSSKGAFKVHLDEYVTDDTGTGCVHLAPAHGEDDNRVMKKSGFNEVPTHVDENGLLFGMGDNFDGLKFYETNVEFVKLLKVRGVVFKAYKELHKYPMCPRTDEPLLYRAVDSWYLAVEQLKDKMLKNNESVNWNPNHLKEGRFGNWLRDARDWAVSRNRVWGNPMPVWVNDVTGNMVCMGSVQELESLTGQTVTDLHTEHVNDLTFTKEGEEGVYTRVDEVFDCWFESGAMPYAQHHYPFKDKEGFENKFQADFVAEGLDQTRGWFYTLNVLSTALFDKPAFKNVVVNGMVLAKDGKKMSKRLKNYTPPLELLEENSADALRVYLVSSNLVKGEEQKFDDEGVREVSRRLFLPLTNTLKFYKTYRDLDEWDFKNDMSESTNLLDQWMLLKLDNLKYNMKHSYENYKPNKVVSYLMDFTNELTNTYVRLNRKRFWNSDNLNDKKAAYSTLYRVLNELSHLMAPLAPFFAEHLYQEVNKYNYETSKSVHLETFPTVNDELLDENMSAAVNSLNDLLLMGRKKRNQFSLKVRQPLAKGVVVSQNKELLDSLQLLDDYLKNELNLKDVEYSVDESSFVDFKLKPNFKNVGKMLGKNLKEFQNYLSSLSNNEVLEYEKNPTLTWNEFEFKNDDLYVTRSQKDLENLETDGSLSLLLDLNLTPDLVEEGYGRELTAFLQDLRKSKGFNVEDRLNLYYFGNTKGVELFQKYQNLLEKEVLLNEVEYKTENNGDLFKFEHLELSLTLFN